MLTLQSHLAHNQLHNKWHTNKDPLLFQKFKTIAIIFNCKAYVFLMVGRKNRKQQCTFILDFDSLFITWKKENNNGTFQKTSKTSTCKSYEGIEFLYKWWVIGRWCFSTYLLAIWAPTNSLLTILAFESKKLWIPF
jgi:hypothetical protein